MGDVVIILVYARISFSLYIMYMKVYIYTDLYIYIYLYMPINANDYIIQNIAQHDIAYGCIAHDTATRFLYMLQPIKLIIIRCGIYLC